MKKNTRWAALAVLSVIAAVAAGCGGGPGSEQISGIVGACESGNLAAFKGELTGEAHKQYANEKGFKKVCDRIQEEMSNHISAMDGSADVKSLYGRMTIQEETLARQDKKSRTRYSIKEAPGISFVQSCTQSCGSAAGDGSKKCDPVYCDISEIELNRISSYTATDY